MKKLLKRRGGFTLIELMIVVAIIGILAAIAIPNFLRFQLKAKTSEGKANLAAIRTAEESHFAELGFYVSASPSPAAIPGTVKAAFVNVDGTDMGFDRVGWSPEGRVYFNYGVSVNGNGYTSSAAANIDGVGNSQTWGYKKRQNGTTDVAGQDHGGGVTCDTTGLQEAVVGACDGSSGQSVF